MAFTAPVLWTEIDPTTYQAQLDLNFQKIQAALYNIQNELSTIDVISGGLSPSNLSWIERAVRYEGVIGSQSFMLSFDSDEENVTISHPGQDSLSSAIVNGLFHYTSTERTIPLTPLAAAGDGTYQIILGIKTLGAPAMEIVVDEDHSDAEQDLTIWSFDYERSGSSYTVSNLRREAEIIIDRESFTKAFRREQHIALFVAGALGNSAGYLDAAFVTPFACEILSAQFYMKTGPTGSTVELGLTPLSDLAGGNILSSTVTYTTGQYGVRSATGSTPAKILDAGDALFIEKVQADSGDTAADLTVTIGYRRVYHDVL